MALATVALYTSCGVRHSAFMGQLSLFQQRVVTLLGDLKFSIMRINDRFGIFHATVTKFCSAFVENRM